MATLTATSLARTGISLIPTTAADAAGDECLNPSGDLMLVVKNASGASITVTRLIRAAGPDGATVTNPTVTVAAGATIGIGPLQTAIHNDANGLSKITYSAVTSVTVLAVRCNP